MWYCPGERGERVPLLIIIRQNPSKIQKITAEILQKYCRNTAEIFLFHNILTSILNPVSKIHKLMVLSIASVSAGMAGSYVNT